MCFNRVQGNRKELRDVIGLCTSGQDLKVYRKPNQELAETIDEFVHSFAIKSLGCKKAEKIQQLSSENHASSSESNSKESEEAENKRSMGKNGFKMVLCRFILLKE